MVEIKHQETKGMVHEEEVPAASSDAQYHAAVTDLVNAYNKAALKAKYPNASPRNIATFYKNVQFNIDMLPLLVKHIDEWFRWNGRKNDPTGLGDRSISMLAYNLRPFYEYIESIPTEEQIRERKERDLVPSIAGWSEDEICSAMKHDSLLEWTEEAKLFAGANYKVDLERETLIFPNGTIVTRANKDDYIKFRDMEYGREEAIKRAKARRKVEQDKSNQSIPQEVNTRGNLTLGSYMKASASIMDHLDDDD